MDKFNKILDAYKNNRPLFNIIITFILGILIVWQTIFTLISPNRFNIFILLILIFSFGFFFLKINGSN
jgi:hypothetical protein